VTLKSMMLEAPLRDDILQLERLSARAAATLAAAGGRRTVFDPAAGQRANNVVACYT
jgi:hypothetical protein